ncbi:MAG TPA: PAS domain S-box protein, partial [Bacteroidota bacterium]|nr:PAS domain S-box protein [Bacteroidota bacterium]
MSDAVDRTRETTGTSAKREQRSIIVAAGDETTCEDVCGKLIEMGYDVLCRVSNGNEALEHAVRLKPDLVLTEIMLNGGMDGIALAEQLGNRLRLPVVFLIQYLDDDLVQRAQLTGPFGFVMKPFDERELKTVVEMVLYKSSMEQALRMSEQKFSKAFQMTPDSVNINRLSDGMYIEINDGFTVLTGYTRDDVQGRTSLDIGIWCDPEKRKTLLRGLMESGEVKNLEAEFRRKDGSVGTGLMSATIIELDGEKHILSITRDISDRKRAEEALRLSEERYREFFEQDLTGDFISTVGGVIVDCNPAFARIFGFSSLDEAVAADPHVIYKDSNDRRKLYEKLEREKKLENLELEARRTDGTPLYLIENLIGIFDESGRMTHVRGYVVDNTERKVLENALVQAQKMESVGTLASGIAHDFNNVLNNILGFANQLKKYANDPTRVLKYSESIEKSAARGAGLARQLMSFVRRKNRESAVVPVEEIIDEVIELASETFPKSIRVQKTIAPLQFQVYGDRSELYQALLNLCLNARDAIVERSETVHESRIDIAL